MTDFAARIATQEWWSGFGFTVLVIGLAGELGILAIPSHHGKLEKILGAIFTLVVIVGCAFEHVADNRISDLVSQEEAAAKVEVGKLNATASAAVKRAAELGISVSGLDQFVSRKIGEINRSLTGLGDAERHLNKANDAVQLEFANAGARRQPRLRPLEQMATISREMKAFKGTPFAVIPQFPPGDIGSEQGDFARHLTMALQGAGWIKNPALYVNPEWKAPESDPAVDTSGCIAMSGFDPEGRVKAIALSRALEKLNIECRHEINQYLKPGNIEVDIGIL